MKESDSKIKLADFPEYIKLQKQYTEIDAKYRSVEAENNRLKK